MSREVRKRTRSRWSSRRRRRVSETVIGRWAWLHLHKTRLKCSQLHSICYGFFFFSCLVHSCFRRSHGRTRTRLEEKRRMWHKREREREREEIVNAIVQGIGCDEDDVSVCVKKRERMRKNPKNVLSPFS